MFEPIKQYLKLKASFPHRVNLVEDHAFLSLLADAEKNPEFIKSLVEYEKTAGFEEVNKNIPIRKLLLDHLAYYPAEEFPKWQDFDTYLQVVKKIMVLLPLEILDLEVVVVGEPCNISFTFLSLSIEYLLRLYEKNRASNFAQYKVYQTMQLIWKKEIIDPLLALECDLDKGSCNRIPILSACFREYLPPQDDQCLSVLIEAFIEKTKYVDKSDMRGVTALVTASLHPLVADVIIIDLIKKGADVNVRSHSSLCNRAAQPLLCHLVSAKLYTRLALLLQFEADPNLQPEADEFIPIYLQTRETWLSAYQLAIALGDDRAVNIIKKYSKKLSPRLSSIEFERDYVTNRNIQLRYQGTPLYLRCKSRLFNDAPHFLTEIFQKYGIKCYVKKISDRQNMAAAIAWLMEVAPQTAAGRFWNLAMNYLKREFEINTDFNIFVSPAPAIRNKTKAYDSKQYFCEGVLSDDIHILSGLSKEKMIKNLAHETGHLVDVKSFKLFKFYISSRELEEFKKAISTDLKNMPPAATFTDMFLQENINNIKEAYVDDKRIGEYFTYLFFEFPIKVVLDDEALPESEILASLNKCFPQSYNWYCSQEEYLLKNVETAPKMSIL